MGKLAKPEKALSKEVFTFTIEEFENHYLCHSKVLPVMGLGRSAKEALVNLMEGIEETLSHWSSNLNDTHISESGVTKQYYLMRYLSGKKESSGQDICGQYIYISPANNNDL